MGEIEHFSPQEGQLSGNSEIVITGKHFVPDGLEVWIGDQQATSVQASDLDNEKGYTKIRAIVPAIDAINDSFQDATVRVKSGGEWLSAPEKFSGSKYNGKYRYLKEPEVNDEAYGPTEGISSGGTQILIEGKHFVPGSTRVFFGNKEATNVVASDYKEGEGYTKVTATSPSYLDQFQAGNYQPGNPGTIEVNVRIESGIHAITITPKFTYKQSKPTITHVSKSEVRTGDELTISGTDFLPGVKVYVGEKQIAATDVERLSSSTIWIKKMPLLGWGDKEIKIENLDEGSAVLASAIYFISQPVIHDIVPKEGPVGMTANVTITGENFIAGETEVYIGAVHANNKATNITVADDNRTLTATLPALTALGAKNIYVVVRGVEAVLNQGFKHVSNPTITKVEIGATSWQQGLPGRAQTNVLGGDWVTVTGTDFYSGTKVFVGAKQATNVVVQDQNVIVARVPAGEKGLAHVRVENTDSGKATATEAVEYTQSQPAITEITNIDGTSPAKGTVLGGTQIIISGTNFVEKPKVYLGIGGTGGLGTELTVVQYNGNQLTVIIPASPDQLIGGRRVTVVNPDGGTAILENGFTYVQSQPAISEVKIAELTPETNKMSTVTEEIIALTGSDFQVGAELFVGTGQTQVKIEPSNILYYGTNEIRFKAPESPEGYAGFEQIRLVNPDGGAAVVTRNDRMFEFVLSQPQIDEVIYNYELYQVLGEDKYNLLAIDAIGVYGGHKIVVEGQEFSWNAKVSFKNAALNQVVQVSQADIGRLEGNKNVMLVKAPAMEPSNNITMVIENPDGAKIELAGIKFVTPPRIFDNGIVPAKGQVDGGDLVEIRGIGFKAGPGDPNPAVFFGTQQVAPEEVEFEELTGGEQVLLVKTPANTLGNKTVAVINDAKGVGLAWNYFEYIGPLSNPKILEDTFKYSIDGDSAQLPLKGPTTGGTEIVFEGEDIRENAQFSFFNGSYEMPIGSAQELAVIEKAPGEFVTRVKLVTPAATDGQYRLRVVNNDGRQAQTTNFVYLYQAPEESMQITGISPKDGPSAGGQELTIFGRNFGLQPGESLQVLLGGHQASEVLLGAGSGGLDMITAVTPSVEPNTWVNVIVQKVHSGQVVQQAIMPQGYYYLPVYSNPIIDRIVSFNVSGGEVHPAKGPIAGGNTIEITGENFMAVAGSQSLQVFIDGKPAPAVEVISSKLIRAVVPAGTKPGSVKVKVVNPDGKAVEKADGYYYEIGFVNITSVTPNFALTTGSTNDYGDDFIEIRGQGFTPDTQVFFGDVPAVAQYVIYLDHQRLAVKVPANTPGPKRVRVINGYGSAEYNWFTYYLERSNPTIDRVLNLDGMPFGSTAGGETIEIFGSNFMSGAIVLFNGKASPQVIVEPGRIRSVLPKLDAQGPVDVAVLNYDAIDLVGDPYLQPTPKGQALFQSSNEKFFAVLAKPSITNIDPDKGMEPRQVEVEGEFIDTWSYVQVAGQGFKVNIPGIVKPQDVIIKFGVGSSETNWSPLLNSAASSQIIEINQLGTQATVKVPAKPDVPGELVGLMAINPYLYLHPVTKQPWNDSIAEQLALKNYLTAAATSYGKDIKINSFLYTDATASFPEIDTVIPAKGPVTGGTQITITGENFEPDALVFIGGKLAKDIQYLNATSIRALTPTGERDGQNNPLPAEVKVVNVAKYGEAVWNEKFEYADAGSYPVISSITPNKGTFNGGQIVTIKGNQFQRDAQVIIGETPAKTTWVSQTELRVTIPKGKPGKVDVTAINYQEFGVVTLRDGYEYIIPTTYPVVDQVEPAKGVAAGGNWIDIYGSSFVQGARVQIGHQVVEPSEIIFFTNKHIRLRTPAVVLVDDELLPVNREITLENPDGGLAQYEGFQYIAQESQVTISSVTPDRGPLAGNAHVYITGSGFAVSNGETVKVFFGGLSAQVLAVSDSLMKVKTPPGAKAGLVDVTVVKPDLSVANKAKAYEYLQVTQMPKIDSIYLNKGVATGGTPVRLEGSGFKAGARVYFNGTEATGLEIDGNNKLFLKTPPYPQQNITEEVKVDVTVANLDGSVVTIIDGFTYVPVPQANPTITSLNPAIGDYRGGTDVALTGTNFKQTTQLKPKVFFGFREANPDEVVFSSSTRVTVKTPPGEVGYTEMTIINHDFGQYTTDAEAFQYIEVEAIQISSIEPNEGPNVGGTRAVIKGSNFQQGATVTLGSYSATVEQITPTEITIITPFTPYRETVDVTVLNPDTGKAVLEDGFTYFRERSAPDTPWGLRATAFDDATIKLQWYDAEFTNSYEIYVSSSSNGTYTFLGQTTNLEYFADKLRPSTTYYFKVRAVNELGASSMGNYAYAKTKSDSGDLVEPSPQISYQTEGSNTLVVTIPSTSTILGVGSTLNLNNSDYNKLNVKRVVLPRNAGASLSRLTLVTDKWQAIFNYGALSVPSTNDHVVAEIAIVAGQDFSAYTSRLERRAKAVSPGVKISVGGQREKAITQLDQLSGNIGLSIPFNANGLTQDQLANLAIYRYDIPTREWTRIETTVVTNASIATASVNSAGIYAVLSRP
ncbi:MAG: IPT/TIG domain-containing protein [Bacillota bacterium]|nr:IPT/TIG domain-containing protein [Bacillota bacterium]